MEDGIGERKESGAGPDFVGVGASREPYASRLLFCDVLAELVNVHARQVKLANLLLERHSAQ
jgi:hypothetical protein